MEKSPDTVVAISEASDPDKKLDSSETLQTDGVHVASVALPQKSTERRTWKSLLIDALWPESRGIQPLTLAERSDPHFLNGFTLWLSANMTIAAFATGTLGPALYALDLSSSLAVIGCVNVLSCAVPALVGTWAPKLGMRQMVAARYAFGLIVVMPAAIINCASMIAFCFLNAIVGGQALVAASRDFNLSLSVGIVIIAVAALFLSFLGYRALQYFERFAWIPILIAFVILAVCAGVDGGLSDRADLGPVTAANVLSFIAIIFGWTISWTPLACDFFAYLRPDVSRIRLFLYTFFGLYLPCCLVQMLGAAIYLGSTTNDAWMAGYEANNVGGLIVEVLLSRGLGNFARFLMVVFALGMVTNNGPTIYSFSLNCQIVLPFMTRFPRWIFAIGGTAIYLVLALVGRNSFTPALSNFAGLLSYWTTIFAVIILLEHYLFRRNDFTSYDVRDWNKLRRLPPGLAALFAALCGGAGAIVGMDQVWYRGPIAIDINPTFGGDLGFEMAGAMTCIGYIIARYAEKRYIEPWWSRPRPELTVAEESSASDGK